jgi:hypothetical protein
MHHLKRSCIEQNCPFDHYYADPGILHILKQVTRSTPCAAKGDCRDIMCFYGHHCPRKGCDGIHGCRFPPRLHHFDSQVAEWQSQSLERLGWLASLLPDGTDSPNRSIASCTDSGFNAADAGVEPKRSESMTDAGITC